MAIWLGDMALAVVCWAHPVAARAGVLLAGLFMAVPCFVPGPPLLRVWLMCCMAFPLVIASVPVLAPQVTGFQARLALFFSWDHTRELSRRPRCFDAASLLHLLLASAAFGATLAVVESVPVFGPWLLLRWLAGGLMILALAEMFTAAHKFVTAAAGLMSPYLMRSPILSASLREFWSRRWNPGMSFLFRRSCFDPLAPRHPLLALVAAFAASALAHVLLVFMAMLQWTPSLVNASFFLAQIPLILAERRMKVHRWPALAAHAWTLAALAVTAPLFVEPVLQILDFSFHPHHLAAPAAIIALCFIVVMEAFFAIGGLLACTSRESDLRPFVGFGDAGNS